MRTRVKICGLTRKQDVMLAADLGADAVGFVFAPSPRRVSEEFVSSIRCDIPPFVTVVGVFVNEEPEIVREIYRACKLDMVQLHGTEDISYARSLGVPYLKAFKARSGKVIREIVSFGEKVFLLDSGNGGTGEVFDWEIAKTASGYGRVVLAGGLNPGNIDLAIKTVKPYAIDISSGLESEPGIKNKSKMKKLFEVLRCK